MDMHRAFLRLTTLFVLLAVMTAAGGCVALYTVSRAVDRPDAAGGGVGLPLFPPGTPVPSLQASATVTVPTWTPGGDGLPFNPHMADTSPPPSPRGTDTPIGTPRSSNATAPWVSAPTDTPRMGGPPPHDEIPRPSLPATPL